MKTLIDTLAFYNFSHTHSTTKLNPSTIFTTNDMCELQSARINTQKTAEKIKKSEIPLNQGDYVAVTNKFTLKENRVIYKPSFSSHTQIIACGIVSTCIKGFGSISIVSSNDHEFQAGDIAEIDYKCLKLIPNLELFSSYCQYLNENATRSKIITS